MGRWINRDLIREKGGVNLYSFIKNNPENFCDAYGLLPGYYHMPMTGIPEDENNPFAPIYLGGGHWFNKPSGSAATPASGSLPPTPCPTKHAPDLLELGIFLNLVPPGKGPLPVEQWPMPDQSLFRDPGEDGGSGMVGQIGQVPNNNNFMPPPPMYFPNGTPYPNVPLGGGWVYPPTPTPTPDPYHGEPKDGVCKHLNDPDCAW